MAITNVNLSQPIDWKSVPSGDPLLDDLQANILKGHGRGKADFLFFTLSASSAKTARAFKLLGKRLTSARTQLIETEVFKGTGQGGEPVILALLAATAFQKLGKPMPGNPEFQAGMKARKNELADPDSSTWDEHLRSFDMLLIVAEESDAKRASKRLELIALLNGVANLVGSELGIAIKNSAGEGLEHFGYVDGRSQPLFLKDQLENEENNMDGIDVWDPFMPASQFLDVAGENDLKGSYFVFRKLEQNVKGFKNREEALGLALGLEGENAEIAGAMAVGRFEDGTPLILANAETAAKPVNNNFDYSSDLDGKVCPFQAHIRKTNPRGDSTRLGATEAKERSHIMARRGLTYGKREPDLSDRPERGVGLLFMAYMSNIGNQFEFTQKSWANDERFVKAGTGLDPVIGQGGTGGQKWNGIDFDFAGFVTMKGGEYLYAPLKSFFG